MEENIATTATTKKSKKGLFIVLGVIILVIGLATGLYLVTRPQPETIQNRAAGPACPVEGSVCRWDAVTGATSYTFTITDLTTTQSVKSGTTTSTEVRFTPEVDHRYRCQVFAVNSCGNGPPNADQSTCVGTQTPTPTEIPTETPVPTGEVTPTPTETPVPTSTMTPTPTSTATPTPTGVNAPTPTPTEIIIAQSNPTSTPAPTSVQPTTEATATTAPTEVPQAGSASGVTFMVAAGLIFVTLLLVF